MKSWIALILALAAGGGIGYFLGFGVGRKKGIAEGTAAAHEQIAWAEAGTIDDAANF